MIHMTCNIDASFMQHCAVTLVSLFKNSKSADICIHIVAPSFSKGNQRTLRNLVAFYGNDTRFYFLPRDLLSCFAIKKFGKRISMATHYRCMSSAILPNDMEKILYLGCDVVVLGDISEFWNTDLSGCGAACIEDISKDEDEHHERLHYDRSYFYFNAGVLLINLDYWREHRVDKQCVEYLRIYPEHVLFNDQGLLNVVLYRDEVFVPLKWNMQDKFYRHGIDKRVADWNSFREELLHPVILHYTNKRPRNYDSMHPLRSEYYKYLDMTPWQGQRPLSSLKKRVQWCMERLPYVFRFRKPRYMGLDEWSF